MSTAEILSLISLVSFIISGVCLVLAACFFIKFNIPAVIGDLSGRTARKSIARVRASNEKAGGQGYKPSAANLNRGKLTDTMHHAVKPAAGTKDKADEGDQRPETGLLAENKATAVPVQQTALLEDNDATGMLIDDDATAPLYEASVQSVRRTGGKRLVMLDDVMLIHTDEVLSECYQKEQ